MKIVFLLIFNISLLQIIFSQPITIPVKNSIDDLNQNLDLNAFFHYHHKSQHASPFKCSSKDGPICNFINGQILGEKAIRNKSQLQDLILEEMHHQSDAYDKWAATHSNNEQIYLTASSLKEQYFEEQEGRKKKNEGRIQNILLTFNDLKISSISESLNSYEYKITQKKKEFKLKNAKQKISKSDNIKESLQISFKNLFTPKKNQVYSNWLSKYHKASEIDEQFSNKQPSENYIYTNADSEGYISFSAPVKFYQLFIRFHDFETEKEKTLQSQVKFFLGNKLISIVDVQQANSYNKWLKIVLKGKLIDQIVLTGNLDIDNIYISSEYYQELEEEKQPKLKAFQKNGEKYEQLEEIEKEITEAIKTKFEDMEIDIQVMTGDDFETLKKNLQNKSNSNKAKLRKKSDKYNLIEEEISNLERITLNANILTMSDKEFQGLIAKFIALKKEVIEVNDSRILQQYEEIMLALREIEKIRELGTVDSETASLKQLSELEEKLTNGQIDLTKFPGFIEENSKQQQQQQQEQEEDYQQQFYSLEGMELSEEDEEDIKRVFREFYGQELEDRELDEAVKQLNGRRAKRKKKNSN